MDHNVIRRLCTVYGAVVLYGEHGLSQVYFRLLQSVLFFFVGDHSSLITVHVSMTLSSMVYLVTESTSR